MIHDVDRCQVMGMGSTISWSWDEMSTMPTSMEEQTNDTIHGYVYHIVGVTESHDITPILPNDNKHIAQCPITVIM